MAERRDITWSPTHTHTNTHSALTCLQYGFLHSTHTRTRTNTHTLPHTHVFSPSHSHYLSLTHTCTHAAISYLDFAAPHQYTEWLFRGKSKKQNNELTKKNKQDKKRRCKRFIWLAVSYKNVFIIFWIRLNVRNKYIWKLKKVGTQSSRMSTVNYIL